MEPPRPTREQRDDRTADSGAGQSGVADDRNIPDIDTVYNAVEYIDELRDHRRNGKTKDKAADRVLPQMVLMTHTTLPYFMKNLINESLSLL